MRELFPLVMGRILFFSIDVSPLVFINIRAEPVVYNGTGLLRISALSPLHHNSATYMIAQERSIRQELFLII